MDNAIGRNPAVSVIIPAYNMPHYLNQAVESVCSQTFTDYEIIVADDASPDEAVSQYKLPENARLIRRKERFGAAAATRNTGLKEARGKYVAFLDQDDLWLPDKLAMQVQALEENPEATLVYCHYNLVDQSLEPLPEQHRPRGFVRDPLRKMITGCFIRTPSAVLVKRDVLEECGLFDESIHGASDWDMWLRIARNYRFAAITEPLVNYRLHPDQLRLQNRMMSEAKIKIMEKTLSWASGERPSVASLVKRCYCRILRQTAKAALLRNDPSTAIRHLRNAAAIWPWNVRTYGLMLQAWISLHRSSIMRR